MKKSTPSLNAKKKILVKALLFGCAILCPALMFNNVASAMFSGSEDFDPLDSFYEKNYSTEDVEFSAYTDNENSNFGVYNNSIEEVFGEESIDIANVQKNVSNILSCKDDLNGINFFGQNSLAKGSKEQLEKLNQKIPTIVACKDAMNKVHEDIQIVVDEKKREYEKLTNSYGDIDSNYKKCLSELASNFNDNTNYSLNSIKKSLSEANNLYEDSQTEKDPRYLYPCLGNIINAANEANSICKETIDYQGKIDTLTTSIEQIENQKNRYQGDYPTYQEECKNILLSEGIDRQKKLNALDTRAYEYDFHNYDLISKDPYWDTFWD